MRVLSLLICFLCSTLLHAEPTQAQLSLWVNEAIVSTYTYAAQDDLTTQKKIAHYFTTKGWIAYSTALNASKLPEVIKQNHYDVTAVAVDTPEVHALSKGLWRASMSVLVVYKNPEHEQKQTLLVTLQFKAVSGTEGVRGLAIESFQSKVEKPACQCDL